MLCTQVSSDQVFPLVLGAVTNPMETPFPFLIALTDTFINIFFFLIPLDLKAGAVHYVELFMDLWQQQPVHMGATFLKMALG